MTPDLASRVDALEIRLVEMRALLTDVLACTEAQKQAQAALLRLPKMTAQEYLDFYEAQRERHFEELQKRCGELLCSAAQELAAVRIESSN